MRDLDRSYSETWQRRSKRLKELGYNSYAEFLESDYWAGVKAKARRRKHFRVCKMCGSTKNINLHHRSYKQLGQVHELINIVALCQECHKSIHDVAAGSAVSVRIATRKILKQVAKPNRLPRRPRPKNLVYPPYNKSPVGCCEGFKSQPNTTQEQKEIDGLIRSCCSGKGGYNRMFADLLGLDTGPQFRLKHGWKESLIKRGCIESIRKAVTEYHRITRSATT
jgi:5-methylcytosine-specific restriction endonuclease McrA